MFKFKIEKGNIVGDGNLKKVWTILRTDGEYIIEKYTKKNKRTLDQNRYYRKIIDIIAKEVGDDKDYIHEALKMKFLLDKSKKLPYVKSTSKLDTIEFTEYIEKIRNFISGFGIIIPTPEEFFNSKTM